MKADRCKLEIIISKQLNVCLRYIFVGHFLINISQTRWADHTRKSKWVVTHCCVHLCQCAIAKSTLPVHKIIAKGMMLTA